MNKPIRRGLVAGIFAAAIMMGAGIYPPAIALAQQAAAEQVTVVATSPWWIHLLPTFLPGFAELVLTGLFGLAIMVSRWAKAKWNIDAESRVRQIESEHRAAMQSAIVTITANLLQDGMIDKAGRLLPGTAEVKLVRDYINQSVPEAAAKFKPSDEVLANLATRAIVELTNKVAPVATTTIYQPDMPDIPDMTRQI